MSNPGLMNIKKKMHAAVALDMCGVTSKDKHYYSNISKQFSNPEVHFRSCTNHRIIQC